MRSLLLLFLNFYHFSSSQYLTNVENINTLSEFSVKKLLLIKKTFEVIVQENNSIEKYNISADIPQALRLQRVSHT